MLPIQSGDVETTFAETKLLNEWINYKPSTSLDCGVKKFIEWYLKYN